MIMISIKEALTFDDVTLAPKYSKILPSETNTDVTLTKDLKLKIPLLALFFLFELLLVLHIKQLQCYQINCLFQMIKLVY